MGNLPLNQMMKILKILKIAGIVRLLLAADSNEEKALARLGKAPYTYTMNYDGPADRKGATDNYCEIRKANYDMLPGMEKELVKPGKSDAKVVNLARFYGSDSPRKWIDHVVFYSTGERHTRITDSGVFIGVALYSQHYKMHGKPLETLVDNMFRLYVQPAILDKPGNFYSTVYKNLRSNQELSYLEDTMKDMLRHATKLFKISSEIKDGNLRMLASEICPLDDWCERRSLAEGDIHGKHEADAFENVVMERLPLDATASSDSKIVLLTLIGMIRSGRHVVSVKCSEWLNSEDFGRVLALVNTNRNLVGVTELKSSMKLEEMLRGIKGQINYLEVMFAYNNDDNIKTLDYIKTLGAIKMNIVLYSFDTPILREILSNPSIDHVYNLKIVNGEAFLSEPDRDTLKALIHHQKIGDLELYSTEISLERFLESHAELLKEKLTVLAVSNIGKLDSARIDNALLSSLRLERLDIERLYGSDMANLDKLLSRGIITSETFRYLVFTTVKEASMESIIGLRDQLRKERVGDLPVVLTNIKPPGLGSEGEPKKTGVVLYEIYPNEMAHRLESYLR